MKYNLWGLVNGKRIQHMGVYEEKQMRSKKSSMKKKHPEMDYEFAPREVENGK